MSRGVENAQGWGDNHSTRDQRGWSDAILSSTRPVSRLAGGWGQKRQSALGLVVTAVSDFQPRNVFQRNLLDFSRLGRPQPDHNARGQYKVAFVHPYLTLKIQTSHSRHAQIVLAKKPPDSLL